MEDISNLQRNNVPAAGRLRRLAGWLAPVLDSDYLGAAAVAESSRSDGTTFRSQAARGEPSPRRYVGRPSRGAAPGSPQLDAVDTGMPRADARSTPWSMRLAVVVALVCALGVGLRVTGVFTLPVDPPSGVEATHAAFSHLLAGRVQGSLDPVRYFPPPAPWYGPAPANPASGLPVYGWLTAASMQLLGAGDWTGRALSMLFSVLAGLILFGIVRRTAGARAGLYALLFFGIAPLSVVLGQQFSPAALSLALQAWAMAALVNWRLSVSDTSPTGSGRAFGLAAAAGALACLVDPGSIFLVIPAAYLALSTSPVAPEKERVRAGLATRGEGIKGGLRQTWDNSPNRGRLAGYGAALLGAAALWPLIMSGAGEAMWLGEGDGGGGIGAVVAALLDGATYVRIVGGSMEQVLTILGALLLFGGLLRGARQPAPLLFHAWLLAGLAHVIAGAGRVALHDDALMPLLLPACALVGLGAAWAGALPARVWLAITEQRRESDAAYSVSPHTSWLLDLPEELAPSAQPRSHPQAQLGLARSVAERAQAAGSRARRVWIMGVGNAALLVAFGVVLFTGWGSVQARLEPSVAAIELAQAGRGVAGATPEGSRLVVVGPHAPEMLSASGRTGWALPEEDFSIVEVQRLQREGAAYLLGTDQEWLGRQPDYIGLLTNYSVAKLDRGYILFDLATKPAANDRLYFLESGHTLGGKFRRFWEQNGGVARLGYPISEELEETNPLDGERRMVQYFERAVVEHHPEFAGTPDEVMLAAVGRWVTKGKEYPTVPPFEATPERAYFPQTGHSVKEAFWRFWQREGGVAKFGYPISEELPEINPADNKVYTVQYFERARFEWHPTDAGTPSEVQLGLIGKQAYERRK